MASLTRCGRNLVIVAEEFQVAHQLWNAIRVGGMKKASVRLESPDPVWLVRNSPLPCARRAYLHQAAWSGGAGVRAGTVATRRWRVSAAHSFWHLRASRRASPADRLSGISASSMPVWVPSIPAGGLRFLYHMHIDEKSMSDDSARGVQLAQCPVRPKPQVLMVRLPMSTPRFTGTGSKLLYCTAAGFPGHKTRIMRLRRRQSAPTSILPVTAAEMSETARDRLNDVAPAVRCQGLA